MLTPTRSHASEAFHNRVLAHSRSTGAAASLNADGILEK